MRGRTALLGLVLAAATAGCQQQLEPAAVLASGETGVQSLTVDGSYVYWTTSAGNVKRVPTTGGTAEVIASDQASADNLVVDDTHLAWSTGATLVVFEKSTSAMTTFAAQGQVQRLSTDGTSLYWTAATEEGGSVLTAPKDGSVITPLATAQTNPLAVHAGSANLLWANASGGGGEGGSATTTPSSILPSDTNAVLAVPPTGGAETLVVPAVDRCVSLTTDTGRIYWADAADSQNGTIAMSALDGTNEQTLSTGETNLWSVATDSASVFYSSLDGRLNLVPVTGGSAATPFITGPVGRVSFALDITNVYWANAADGAILTAPKPVPPTDSQVDAGAIVAE